MDKVVLDQYVRRTGALPT